jgi:hypothetical protein
MIKVHKMHQSIETDREDFNNRDEDHMTAYSKSLMGRKSKVTEASLANTE